MKTLLTVSITFAFAVACFGAIFVEMTKENATVTGYHDDVQYSWRGKIKDDAQGIYLQVKDCDLTMPYHNADLEYSAEHHGVVVGDDKTGWDAMNAKHSDTSVNDTRTADQTFKLQRLSNNWVPKTITWNQKVINANSEGSN